MKIEYSRSVCYFSPSVYYRNSELSIGLRTIAKYEKLINLKFYINITSLNAITLVFHFSTYRPSSFKHFCPIRYRGAISRLAVAWTAASIVLCIGHSEACWQMEQMFEELGQYVET